MTNRQARRNFKQASKGFRPPITGEWGTWREHDIYSKVHLGVIPMTGIKRFVANDKYSVQFFEKQTNLGKVDHLLISPHNGKPVRSWSDMQRIKDELMGPERLAIEIFPPESQLVDQANCYHLWVLPEGFEFPFGLHINGWSQ